MSAPQDFDAIVSASDEKKTVSASDKKKLSFKKHAIYIIALYVRGCIAGPREDKITTTKPRESQFKFIAERLISTLPEKPDTLVVKTTQELLDQHRTIENTQARQRLEKWACRVIAVYLAGVFSLLILNGLSRILWPTIFLESGFISDKVLYVIFSTTTVNILGLVLIVLRGHFPNKDSKAEADTGNPSH